MIAIIMRTHLGWGMWSLAEEMHPMQKKWCPPTICATALAHSLFHQLRGGRHTAVSILQHAHGA